MQLAERGALRLDDTIRTYLPWFSIQYPDASPVTIRHILTNTSGLPLDATVPHWTEDQFQTWDEIVATSAGRKAIFPPDVKWKYSNYAYTLLGGIIEAVSGQAFRDYIHLQVLEPLGMSDTLVMPAEDDSRMATGYLGLPYVDSRKVAPFTQASGYTPAFGMASTVEDLVRFISFHLSDHDSAVLRASTLRDMQRVHWLEPHWQGGAGLGFVISQSEGRVFASSLGEIKGYTCLAALSRTQRYGIIVLTNAVFSQPNEYALRITNFLLPSLAQHGHRTAQPQLDPSWVQYTGIYTTDWGGDTQVVVRQGQLQIVDLMSVDAPPQVLEPTAEAHEFKIGDGYWVGETCRFDLDESGKVRRMWVGSDYSVPKK